MHFVVAWPALFFLAANLASASPFAAKPLLNPRGLPCYAPYTRVNNTQAAIFTGNKLVYDHGVTLTRYTFRIQDDTLINNRGIDILNRLRCHDGGGIYNNWQFYKEDGVYVWLMEFNEVNLSEGKNAVNKAIQDVTGLPISVSE